MTEFPCPHCRIMLRIREVTYRNRVIPCPDCGQPVLIQEQDGKSIGVIPTQEAPADFHAQLRPKTRWGIPHLVAGTVSVAMVLGILVVALIRPEEPPASPVTNDAPAKDATGSPVTAVETPDPAPSNPPVSMPSHESPDGPPVVAASPQELQLLGIGNLIGDMVNREQRYPSESAPGKSSGWSWIAELADQRLPGQVSRHKDAGWDAAVNDEFVRRAFPEFQNPAIPSKAGDDNYPASHYIGMAGVEGPNAQPGLFETGRPVRPDDVKDGLANTILVAGANSQLGSWARPGRATVRAFSQEPYINGPDGLGTGQLDGMFVLMADGSVKFLNQATDPEVLRRLAGRSDGVSPDAPVAAMPVPQQDPPAPGIPAAVPPLPGMPQPNAPVAVPVAPEEPKIDLKARLDQRLVGFEQTQPSPLQDILFDVQELLGVKIDLSKLPEEVRQRPVKISLKATTVGDVLREIANAAEVGFAVHPDHITIQLR